MIEFQNHEYEKVEHPFAQYIRIIGKGKNGARHLTQKEAFDAMTMIINGNLLDEQLGAFMMLMRMKEESAEELAGFCQAIKQMFEQDFETQSMQPDFDWPCYAGKKRQLPWYLLAALALSDSGYKVFMHGFDGHTIGRMYAQETLEKLGITTARSVLQAKKQLDDSNFTYLCLRHINPAMANVMNKRNIMGLRTPVHTLCRLLNPFHAKNVLQGIFHPAYQGVHQKANVLLGYSSALVYKGEGGEFERNPEGSREAFLVKDGKETSLKFDKLLSRRLVKPELLDIHDLKRVWRNTDCINGDQAFDYGVPTVIGSIELALSTFMVPNTAKQKAQEIWKNRDKSKL
ncbi:glycosyl transferase family protein [Marinicellulosiphila megalodicopiae]|uniref:glycosyl transferase family protein n=1 Tax=Marinicellulosiphila megalodicopiae TaxID=2724896 RepID=UPI003BB083D3